MSRVIVICGPPGVGKTTLAQELSKKFKMASLHKDVIKEHLYALENGRTLDDSIRIGKVAIFLLLDLAEDIIQNQTDIILESAFDHPKNIERFAFWHKKFQVDIRVIICEVAEEERLRRIATRPRHESHHDRERIKLNLYKKSFFDYSQVPGKKLFLNTHEPFPLVMQKAIDFLQTP